MTRRPRPFREKRRGSAARELYDVVLIVCKGSKTEPYYFLGLIKEFRLSQANIKVVGKECGSSPITVVQCAVDAVDQNDGSYDRVFCVFDRDTHPSFEAARDRCHALNKGKRGRSTVFESIISTPSFELWLLLHFRDAPGPYAAKGGKSVGYLAESDLRSEMGGKYEKSDQQIFSKLRQGLDIARHRARILRSTGIDNPYTDVDKLVDYLIDIKSKKNSR